MAQDLDQAVDNVPGMHIQSVLTHPRNRKRNKPLLLDSPVQLARVRQVVAIGLGLVALLLVEECSRELLQEE